MRIITYSTGVAVVEIEAAVGSTGVDAVGIEAAVGPGRRWRERTEWGDGVGIEASVGPERWRRERIWVRRDRNLPMLRSSTSTSTLTSPEGRDGDREDIAPSPEEEPIRGSGRV
jgi:hypothetical protein